MQISPVAPLAPLSPPSQPLTFNVPAALHERFGEAVARAQRDVAEWVRTHPGAGVDAFTKFITGQIGPQPSSDAEDIALTKAAITTRDAARNRQAIWLDGDGINDAWRGALAKLEQHAGPEQAANGRALLDDARSIALDISRTLKQRYARVRPYQAHPVELPVVPGIVHATGFSYPSGHATHAFVTAGVLAALDPTQTASALTTAEQVAYSRVYASAHYSSDVAMGAYLGAAVGAFLTRAR